MPTTTPSYIPSAIVNAPLDFAWDGPTSHVGPTETVTKLMEQLWDTTTCGQLTLNAGILEWATWRLEGHVRTDIARHFRDAAFAYQVDQTYVDRAAGEVKKAPETPPALSALMKLNCLLYSSLGPKFSSSYYQPIHNTFHSAHLVKHILPKGAKKEFGVWLKDLTERVRAVAKKPDEEFKKKSDFDTPAEHAAFIARHWGRPLPPQILTPTEFDPEKREEEVAKFMNGLNWEENPYLRSPEQMKELGFEGTPYKA